MDPPVRGRYPARNHRNRMFCAGPCMPDIRADRLMRARAPSPGRLDAAPFASPSDCRKVSKTLLVGEGAPAGARRAHRPPPTAPAPGLGWQAITHGYHGVIPRNGGDRDNALSAGCTPGRCAADCAASMIIMRAGRSTPPEDLEYLIVLGAMVRPDGLPTRAALSA